MILYSGLRVYHGSYIRVKKPNLDYCKTGKDFGIGFYTTTDFEQAKRFVKLSVGKAIKNGITVDDHKKGYVSAYEVLDLSSSGYYEFTHADKEWLHCVAAHRKEGVLPQELSKWSGYEIIAGKIANDNTNRIITAYLNGLYGKIGSDSADRMAISLLMPEKLTDQICFKTEKALEIIKYRDAEEVLL